MPKDHYVAQTYLKAFGLTDSPDLVNVVRKSNLSRQNAIPVKSICYGVDWSTTEYIPDNPRAVEDYLKLFEPKWAECVQSISDDTYTITTKYLMSGYLAYLRACTPTAVRLGSEGLSHIVQDLYNRIEEKELTKPDTKYREVIETIRKNGGTKVLIKEGYPKAMGINALIASQKVLSTSPWIVFKNETSTEFITSDNPVCMQYWNSNRCDFYCPLTPHLAIVIHPIRDTEPRENDSIGSLKPEGVEMLNRLMVQSAEDKVIFNKHDGIEDLVKEYQDWRVELRKIKIPVEKGHLIIHQQKPFKAGTCDSLELVHA
jgi:hypothetical protein